MLLGDIHNPTAHPPCLFQIQLRRELDRGGDEVPRSVPSVPSVMKMCRVALCSRLGAWDWMGYTPTCGLDPNCGAKVARRQSLLSGTPRRSSTVTIIVDSSWSSHGQRQRGTDAVATEAGMAGKDLRQEEKCLPCPHISAGAHHNQSLQ